MIDILYHLPNVKTGVVDLTTANKEDDQRVADELLGEDPRKMSKMSAYFFCSNSIGSLEGVKTPLANIMTLVSVLAKCNFVELFDRRDGRESPFVFTMAADYFKVTTGLQFRPRYEEVYQDYPWVQ